MRRSAIQPVLESLSEGTKSLPPLIRSRHCQRGVPRKTDSELQSGSDTTANAPGKTEVGCCQENEKKMNVLPNRTTRHWHSVAHGEKTLAVRSERSRASG